MAAKKLNLSTGKMELPFFNGGIEEDLPTAQSVFSVDLSAILSMFPTKNAAPNAESNGGNSDDTSGLELDLFEGPLYGLMNYSMMPLSDMSDFMVGTPPVP